MLGVCVWTTGPNCAGCCPPMPEPNPNPVPNPIPNPNSDTIVQQPAVCLMLSLNPNHMSGTGVQLLVYVAAVSNAGGTVGAGVACGLFTHWFCTVFLTDC